MANHKSALKRNRQNLLARLRNRANKTKMKNLIKNVLDAIDQDSVEGAQEALKVVIPVIEKTATKGAIHRKNASRKVSRLTKKVNAFVSNNQ